MTEKMHPNSGAEDLSALIEQVVVGGDLSRLTPAQRVAYYRQVCHSLGLNPLTKPFEYVVLSGRLTLYAGRGCTDQLRKRDRVSITITAREMTGDVYLVVARATTPDGRVDEAAGAVSVAGLRGEALANALMKAETKAKRRVTLSICGLGWLDETEVETIPSAVRVEVTEEGEIVAPPKAIPAPGVSQESAPHEKAFPRQKLLSRIEELRAKIEQLSGGKEFNLYHLRNHLRKHFGAERTLDLSDAQLIELGKHLRARMEAWEGLAPGDVAPSAEGGDEAPPAEKGGDA